MKIIFISEILTGLCLIRQDVKIKNIFVNVVYHVRTQRELFDNKW